MTYEMEFVDRREQPTAVVRGRVSHQGIGDFLGSAFGEVMAALGEQAVAIVGPPFARYWPTQDGDWHIEAGFPAAGTVRAQGRVEPSSLPGGRMARTLHVGAYDAVAQAYDAVMAWLTEQGCTAQDAPWESYLDGPEVAEPRTEVFVPCVGAEQSGRRPGV